MKSLIAIPSRLVADPLLVASAHARPIDLNCIKYHGAVHSIGTQAGT